MPTPPRLRFGAYWLDPASEQVGQGTRLVHLTPKAFAVLRYLVERPGQLVTKDELFAAVWAGTAVSDAALTKCVRELRQALKDDVKAPRYIETAHRRGLRFLAPVTLVTQLVRRRASRGQRPPPSTPHPLPPTPYLVGREAELAQLHDWCEQALRGARQLIFVTGEAGIGKTTVVDAFMHRLAREKRVWVARGQCIEHYGSGEAYMPVLEALEQLCRGPAGAQLVPLLRQHAPTWLGQMPALLRGPERERLQRQVQGAGQERMLRELAAALDVLTARQGVVLWLEDLQWSDVSTLDVLSVLGRRQEPARLLVLCTYRPVEVLVRDHPLKRVKQELQVHGQCQELALDFLSAAAVEAYLAGRFPGLEQDAGGLRRLAQFVHQRTDGNALFMVNMVEYVVRQGVLREVEGQWALHRPLEDVAGGVPESLQQMNERHFAHLRPAEQRLLEVASVEGVEFSTTAVAAGLETAADTIEEGCEGLVRRQQFVRASGTEAWPDGTVAGRYRFIHGLYQEVVYRWVTAGRRVRLHQEIGARKEAGYGDRAHEIAAELALHFARGRDYGRAVRYYRQAGAKALAGSAYREAVGCWEQALEALTSLPPDRPTLEQAIDLRCDLSMTLLPLAQHEQTLTHLRAAEPLAEGLGDHRRLGRVYRRIANTLRNLQDYEPALAYCQRAHAMATALGDVDLRLGVNNEMGWISFDLGDYRQAREYWQQALMALQGEGPSQSFDGASLPAPSVQVRTLMVRCLSELGAFADGVAYGGEALQIAEAVDRSFDRLAVYVRVGRLHVRQGTLHEAIPRLEQAVALGQEADIPNLYRHAAASLALAYALAGRTADALALLAQATGNSDSHLFITYGETYLLAGCVEEAHWLAQRALANARERKMRGVEARALWLLGEIARHGHPPDMAPVEAHYQQALALAEELGMRPLQAHCHLGLGTLYATTGRRQQARAALATASAMYRAMDMTFWLPQAEAALAHME